ncbi:MAG: glycine betaine/L-proline ABC transporter substrate-binding protein ProX [Kamptonema sp. SIO4C4]|nr:glycine betaine/L-proline ABC transporter substrate-binding protein ProX [Kamptonema sp. SIO4C4]
MTQNTLFHCLTTLVLTLGLVGCRSSSPSTETVVVRPAYGTLEELFQTEIVNLGLEELGYNVIAGSELEYDIIHEAIASHYLDFTASHWQPLHNEYFQENGGTQTMERVGVVVADARQGYLIDQKTAQTYNITSLEQLQDPQLASVFDTDGDGKANLVGCNPGWGCAEEIEQHLDTYNLRDTVEHDQGNYFALIETAIDRYEEGQPILYYTWTPLWVSEVLRPQEDVTWLAVPSGTNGENTATVDGKNLGFAANQIGVLANKDFLDEHPDVKRWFELVNVPLEQVSQQNLRMKQGENTPEQIRQHATEWIQQNQQQFNSWVDEAQSLQ